MTEVAHDRDRRRRRGFAVERRFGPLRQHAELGELRGEQLLVRGHDRFAGSERGARIGSTAVPPAASTTTSTSGSLTSSSGAVGDRNACGARTAILRHVANRNPRDAELDAVAIGNGVARRSIISSRPRPTVPQPTRPMRISRTGSTPTPSKRGRDARLAAAGQTRRRRAAGPRADPDRRGTRRGRRAIRASTATSARRRPAARDAARPAAPTGNSMSPGTPTTMVSAVMRSQRVTHRRGIADRCAIDRLAQQQERLDRKALGEAPAVMIEVLGDRRTLEVRAAACRSAYRARRGRDTSACRAGARGIMPVATSPLRSRRAPARAAGGASPCPSRRGGGPAEIVIDFAQRSAWRTANATPTMPPRLAPIERDRHVQPQPSSQAATRSARPDDRERVVASAGSSKPCQVEPLPGQHGQSTVCCAGSIRSGAHSAGHQAALPRRRRIAVAERKRRRGDAADDQDDRRGAELGSVDPAAQQHILERAALDRERGVLDDQPPRPQGGGGSSDHPGIV